MDGHNKIDDKEGDGVRFKINNYFPGLHLIKWCPGNNNNKKTIFD